MRIESYNFGKIVIDGVTYRSDVIVFPERVDASWWRLEGHLLQPEDLPFLADQPPAILVVGQGKFGFMKISDSFMALAQELKIRLEAAKTGRAVHLYNQFWESGERSLVGAFHLTC